MPTIARGVSKRNATVATLVGAVQAVPWIVSGNPGTFRGADKQPLSAEHAVVGPYVAVWATLRHAVLLPMTWRVTVCSHRAVRRKPILSRKTQFHFPNRDVPTAGC